MLPRGTTGVELQRIVLSRTSQTKTNVVGFRVYVEQTKQTNKMEVEARMGGTD